MADNHPSHLITEAIQKAHYNEIVEVTLNTAEDHDERNKDGDDDTHVAQHPPPPQEVVMSLVACLDHEHGGIVWNPLPQDLVLARHLQTKRWIFPMLNDHRRNRLYEIAIQQAVQELAKRYKDDESWQRRLPTTIHALDIGSGTGLLGMIVRKYLQEAFDNDDDDDAKNQQTAAVTTIKVTSIEMASSMAQIARQTIQDNATPPLSPPPPQQQQQQQVAADEEAAARRDKCNRITIQHSLIEGHSGEIPPASPPAILCVSELLEDGLLGEGILPTMRDVWKRHLDNNNDNNNNNKSTALMIPQRARVFVQLVSSRATAGSDPNQKNDNSNNKDGWISDYYGPHADRVAQAYEQYARTCGSNNEEVKTNKNNNRRTPMTAAARFTLDADGSQLLLDAPNVVLPVHGGKMLRDKSLIAMTEPTRVLEFEFGQQNDSTMESGCHSCLITTPVTTAGKIEGALVWWELDLWQGVTYSTQPLLKEQDDDWQDHWHTTLHVFSQIRTVSEGDSVTARISHTDERIFVEPLQPADTKADDSPKLDDSSSSHKRLKAESPAFSKSALISPMRAYQLNDVDRTAIWLQAIASALVEKGQDSLVLDLSDFCWCACLAASLGATNIVSVESSTNPVLALTSARVAQVANGFPTDKSRFDILQCHTEQLSLEMLGGEPAGIVMAEYYQVLEGWHLQEALNFFNIVRDLRKKGEISETARILPGYCRIMACAIESAELRSAYKACGDTKSQLMGFDHTYINKLGGDFSQYDLVLPISQYEYTRLSEIIELACLDFERNGDDDCQHHRHVFTSKAKFTRKGHFDAVMVWLEFEFQNYSGGSITLHTCRPSSLQLIRMAKQSEEVFVDSNKCASLECCFRFMENVLQAYDIEIFVEQNTDQR